MQNTFISIEWSIKTLINSWKHSFHPLQKPGVITMDWRVYLQKGWISCTQTLLGFSIITIVLSWRGAFPGEVLPAPAQLWINTADWGSTYLNWVEPGVCGIVACHTLTVLLPPYAHFKKLLEKIVTAGSSSPRISRVFQNTGEVSCSSSTCSPGYSRPENSYEHLNSWSPGQPLQNKPFIHSALGLLHLQNAHSTGTHHIQFPPLSQ